VYQRIVARRRKVGVAVSVLFACAGVTFAARPTPPKTAPATEAVIGCRTLADDAQRLACYDKAVAAMAHAQSSGDLVTLDREQRRTVRRQAFGLSLPALTIFEKGDKPEEVDRLTATVGSAAQTAYGKWVIVLDDGAVWRQTDDTDLLRAPRKGSAVEIRKGVLGSFFVKVDGQAAFRAHRDN
jgi:hypothetical protein